MKKRTVLTITSTILMSFLLTGCLSFFVRKTKSLEFDYVEFNPSASELEKTELNYIYSDLTNNSPYYIDSTPSIGNPHLLVIPIWFADSDTYIPSNKKSEVRRDIERAYNANDEDVGWRSVRSYYNQMSLGKLHLEATVSDWYACGKKSKEFYSEDEGLYQTLLLVEEAVAWYKDKDKPDMSEFDYDQNGYIDGVVLIYGAPDYSVLKKSGASNLWAYTYWIQNYRGTPADPAVNAFFWASYDFMYGSNSGMKYNGGDTTHCEIDTHTYIHEMGHVLGLDDYYDYSGRYIPAGAFSMQDYNVGSHDPYSAMAWGWADPAVITESCTVTLKPFQDNHDIVVLSPEFHDSPFDEYLIVEYYTPTGLNEFDTENAYFKRYPSGPKRGGIRLWHVDGRLREYGERPNSELVTDIDPAYSYSHAFDNTYEYETKTDNCNLLQLIRNNSTETYKPTKALSQSDLFMTGDSFTMDYVGSQFVNTGRLNSGLDLGWSFTVQSITNEGATIEFFRE